MPGKWERSIYKEEAMKAESVTLPLDHAETQGHWTEVQPALLRKVSLEPGHEDRSEPGKALRSQARDLRINRRNVKWEENEKPSAEHTSLSLNDQAFESIFKEMGCSHSE